MQVYRELRILTARPSAADMVACPHALYGHSHARDAYSVGRYVTEVTGAIQSAEAAGLRPIITGGTGLYFKALTHGLSPIPAPADDVRAHWRAQAEELGAQRLHEILATRDGDMARRLQPNDTQRIVRALEVLDSSGKSLTYWQAQPGTAVVDEARAIKLVVSHDRDVLHSRADARFDAMMNAGALGEVSDLGDLQLDARLPAMRALGVAPLLAAAQGHVPLEVAISQAKSETRQYIKRQETWFKKNMIAWKCVHTKQTESSDADLLAFIELAIDQSLGRT